MNKSKGIYNIIDEEGINESIKRVLNKGNFNTYTSPKGLKELRIKISELLNKMWDSKINYQSMLITSGSQQSINLIVHSLLEEGDTVLIEEPTYYGALSVLQNKKVNLVGLKLNEDGLDLKDLEEKIIKYKPKMIYVVPTFNNPTGYAWKNIYRTQFLEVINKYQLLVIEDDPYSLINFTDNKYHSLYALNNGKNIIYLGTFSKYISPSLNVGYILANKDIIDKIYLYKESFDLCTSLFIQLVILDYLENNDLLAKIKEKTKIYKSYLKQSLEELKEEYGDNISKISNMQGGLFFLVEFNKEVDGCLFDVGDKYYIDESHKKETRINICSIGE